MTTVGLFETAASRHQAGRLIEALAAYDAFLAREPRHAAGAWLNRGAVLADLGQPAEALASYDRAIALKPDFAEAFNNRGRALATLGRLAEALDSYDRATALKPDQAAAHNNRGNALKDLGRPEEALASYDRAIALKPGYADAHNNRGALLRDQRRLVEALDSHNRAIALAPGHADAHNNRGNALKDLDRLDEALASYDRAIALEPGHAGAHNNRGHALKGLKRFEEALASYDRALALKPDVAHLAGARLRLRLGLGDWENFARERGEVEAATLAGKPAAAPFDMLALSDSPDAQRRCAERFLAGRPGRGWSAGAGGDHPRPGRPRIGYFSADFHSHATMHLMAEVFERHDKARFETIAFSFGPDRDDAWRRRAVGAFERFIDVRALSDLAVADLARDIGIDIAVDLKGFTEGGRPGIFAARAAPVQINYLGYPATTGAPYIDYMIADRVVVPETQRACYSERIVFLPDSYMANSRVLRVSGKGMTRRDAGLPEGAFVYCCFNSNHKITPDMFDIWMRILRRVEGAVLWLWVDADLARRNLRREAERSGVAASRIVFAGAAPLADHLARLRLADLFLDTLPYNAHTTASDALRMGLPLLTCPGRAFASRVAASLLTAVGLEEMAADGLEAYEALAVDLARRPERLARIRARLVSNLPSCALFDSARFTRGLEAAYLSLHERARAHLPPEDIHVPAQAPAALASVARVH